MRHHFTFILGLAAVLVAAAVPALADTVTLSDISGLQAAIDGAGGARTIELAAGTHVLAGNINVNRSDITIQGQGTLATKIQVSGAGYRFSVTGSGCTIRNLEIEKTDKTGEQNIIWINANGVTIQDNRIHGQFVVGDGEVSRAMVVSPGLSGLLVSGNEIYALRQPGYFSGSLAPAPAGAITGNHVYDTKGWVVEGGQYVFSDNTWGTGATANVYDVAILVTCQSAFYTDIVAMGAANHGAVIEDQRVSPAVLNIVHVDAAAAAGGAGGGRYPYQTIVPASTRVVAGGTILVAAGTYTEQVTIATNDVTLQGAGRAGTIVASPATLVTSFGTKKAVITVNGATGVTVRDLAVDGLGLGNANYQFVGVAFWNAGGALLDADVVRIEDTPFSGAQHGVGVYAYNSTGGPYRLEVGRVNVTDFQKTGMALSGTGLTVDVHDCVVTGAGQTTVTAQNGIQISYGAGGAVTDCAVSGAYYTGSGYTASGLLFYQPSPMAVTGGSVAGCQTGAYFLDVGGSMTNTQITVPLGGGIGAWGIEAFNSQTTLAARAGAGVGTDRVRPQAQPFADEPFGNSATLGTAASLMTLALHGGCLTGPGVTGTEGMDIFSDGGGLSVTADGMEITGWEYGVGVGGAGSPTVDMTHNAIFGNLAYGFALYGSSGACTAKYDWWGDAGGPGVGGANPAEGVDYTPWLVAGTDLTAGCGFGAPPENQLQPVAPSTCITPAHECVAVPVTIARTTGEGVRGYTVDVQLAGGLALCGAGIVQGSYLNSISTTAYQVVDNGGGSYTVDCAILGTPCGAVAASGTLFTIHVGGSGTGTGTVTLSAGELRDCDNATVLSSLGAPVSITVDHSAPAVITALAAAQVKTGNDGDGTTKINVSWPAVESGATVHVYRADFGYYPEYDDDGGTVPAVPTTYPPGTGWTLAGDVAGGTSLADEPPSRGFWYYVAYVEDPCGNVSAVSNRTGGTLDYHLGDVMAGATVCSGNNVVDIGDISLLGGHYGVAAGGSLYLACLDVGPTTNRSVDARPTTDNRINFEDMMMFAINYGTVSVTTAPLTPVAAVASDMLWVDGPAKVTAGQTFTASLRLSGSGMLLGLSAALGWDHAIAEIVGVEAGEMVTAQGGLVLSPGEGVVDCALLGADRRLSGDGELARVTFRALASGAPSLAVATVDARDAGNRTLTLTGTVPTMPTRTSFAPAVPNPFRGTTTLSYALARGGAVELAIYGVDGRRVATLASGVQEAGSYRLTWDGGNARPGLYYARLSTPEGRFTRTLVLVK
jgi:hypothetical protein